jgi:hypothetical protein
MLPFRALAKIDFPSMSGEADMGKSSSDFHTVSPVLALSA